MDRFVVISGCSGGGKSTLLLELARRGYAVVEEPGRRIVEQELAGDGAALPWTNGAAFARRAIDMALADRSSAASRDSRDGWVFFDRGLIDAAAALEHFAGTPALTSLGAAHRYHRRVFMTPPWPEIYASDSERRHGFEEAVAEFQRLTQVYPALGYEMVIIPKSTVELRADCVLRHLQT
ncbi:MULTISPECIES: AAA family ATPase [Methylosinus]|uniref:ATPase n=1 Tax=Methylosinus trichosporium (strain ATCC 35070 / NCIMB 11131 / UNIQEM 75 / OB3b) TaxID=595536 RepID=A0A2D2CWH2_METT3|nr:MULTISPECIES: AAA family ATPase [Methylosinus]ATQ67016.1 ATPase [Methylosinus trichosporium OB3b]OBS54510.1 ATPase [Methylosinus sp. 3S-1]